MDTILSAVNWAVSVEGAAVIFGTLFGLQKAAELVVNLTATPADDRLVAKFYSVVEKVAGIWGLTAKTLPGEKTSEMAVAVAANEAISFINSAR